MDAKNKRFKVVYKETGLLSGLKILVDRKTGVNYLFCENGYAGGLTVMVDKDGKPIVTPLRKEAE